MPFSFDGSRSAPLALATACMGLLGAAAASAQEPSSTTTSPSTQSPSVSANPLWEVGLYPVTGWQPAYPGSDQHLFKGAVLPYAIWRGSLLRVESGVVGVRAVHTPRFEWDMSGSGAFGASANEVRARAGMPSIGTLLEAGPVMRLNLGDLLQPGGDPHRTRLELPLRDVFDASDGMAHRGWTLSPQVSHVAWQGQRSSITAAGSMLFGDRKLASLFYGVDPVYATPGRPAYAARAGLVATRLDLTWRYRISDRLRMQWNLEGETVRGAANTASPLVRRMQDMGVSLSLTWAAFVSSRRGTD